MFKQISDPAFDMDAPVLKDESIRDFQHYFYDARIPDQRGRIELQVQDTSRYFLPAEAFIEVEGEIIKTNTEYLGEVNVGFVNNGIMALFDSATYMIDGKNIESIQKDVDVATTILGLARYSDDYSRSAGPSMMFVKDTSNSPEYQQYEIGRPRNFARNADADVQSMIINVDPDFNLGFRSCRVMLQGNRRVFSCAIPLSHIFGFCRSVRKVIFGAKHTVVLESKATDDDAIWRSPGDAGKVVLTKFSLWMPAMTPSVRVNSQTRSIVIFDNLGVSEVSLRINGHQEPSKYILLNFDQNHVARAYHRLMTFMGRDQNVDTGLQISQLDFTTLYPIYYFSLEHLDLYSQSVVDIHFRARVTVGAIANYRAIAVILRDKSMILEGAGGRMRVVDAVKKLKIKNLSSFHARSITQKTKQY